jgi:hypothetical protein
MPIGALASELRFTTALFEVPRPKFVESAECRPGNVYKQAERKAAAAREGPLTTGTPPSSFPYFRVCCKISGMPSVCS